MLRGAIIGTGNIALKGHLPAYLKDEELKKEIAIVAAVDLSPANLEKAKELLPSVRTYPSVTSLFENEKLDFVDICSPPHSRREIIDAALDHPCHIICEKPLATSVSEGRQIAEKIKEKGVVFVPCHQYRYSAVWKSVKEILDRRELGDVLLAQFNVFRMKADSGNPEWQSEWRVDPQVSGGGIIVDTGSHYCYLLSYLFGKPRRLTARTATLRHHEYPVEDTALILAEYDHLVAEINLTWAADRRENRNLIIGSIGSLWTGSDRIFLSRNGDQKELHLEDVSNKTAYVQWYAELFREFVNRVKEENHGTDFLEEALDILFWTESCYESAAKGITVQLQ